MPTISCTDSTSLQRFRRSLRLRRRVVLSTSHGEGKYRALRAGRTGFDVNADAINSRDRIGELNISTTRIPLPSLDPSLSTPSITLRLPTFLTLHAPANLLYRFSNPTSRLLNLSTSIEGAENFVFAGPRKFPRFVLAPEEERVLTLVVIPLAVGSCSLPRLRVFVDRTAEATRSEDLEEAEVRERVVEEVTVNVETDSMIQSEKAASRAGEVGSRDPLVVLVLPR